MAEGQDTDKKIRGRKVFLRQDPEAHHCPGGAGDMCQEGKRPSEKTAEEKLNCV